MNEKLLQVSADIFTAIVHGDRNSLCVNAAQSYTVTDRVHVVEVDGAGAPTGRGIRGAIHSVDTYPHALTAGYCIVGFSIWFMTFYRPPLTADTMAGYTPPKKGALKW